MKCLLIYPKTPDTFWSFTHAIKYISKKASEIPLGLITMAGLLPESWQLKLVDKNVTNLKEQHLEWADIVFISGMNVHRKSFQNIVDYCNQKQVTIVAGGPMVTIDRNEITGVDHYVLNEAEITLPQFLADFKEGGAKHIYQTDRYPAISKAPVPRWDLLDMDQYATMDLQYSRGCPHNCEFCSVTMLNGRKPRTKNKDQLIKELDSLYDAGWRGDVFIVDDNFIGNRKKLKQETLPAMIDWLNNKDYPFSFITETDVSLVDDEHLMDLMLKAGFNHLFIGVETPNSESLKECSKYQNLNRNIVDSIKKLQQKGFLVSGGFIVGFDNDSINIFQQQIDLIQSSGIPVAMLGILKAPKGTQLFKRLKKENRIVGRMSGNNLDGTTNFLPKMGIETLQKGYKKTLDFIYSKKHYYQRIKKFIKNYKVSPLNNKNISINDIIALLKSLWKLGIIEPGRKYYWKLILKSAFRYPKKLPMVIKLTIYGDHFRKVSQNLKKSIE